FYIDNIVSYVPSAPMNGTFTINLSNPTGGSNFQTFRDAAYALNTRGVNFTVKLHCYRPNCSNDHSWISSKPVITNE
ncbi:MAG TPA: hypothetical protein VK004_03895, partial [Ignavibacteria bacterium]|nr:hypothetical protein [Ignavibacteria bacterium]